MLFSVIIPLYNKADTIRRAIQSVWDQSFRDFELIVVNDGSTDASLEVVMKLANDIPIRVVDRPNGGVSSARNAGVAVANGEYVALLDADDCWTSGYLMELANIVRNNPQAVLVGAGFYWVMGQKCYRITRRSNSLAADILRESAIFQPIHTSSVAIRRDEFLCIGGFDDKHGYYEDMELFFKLAIKYPNQAYVSSCPLVYHMDDAEYSITKQVKLSKLEYPHIVVVENSLASCYDMDKSSILCFARAYALSQAVGNARILSPERNRRFAEHFPFIYNTLPCKQLFIEARWKIIAYVVGWCCSIVNRLKLHSVLTLATRLEIKRIQKDLDRWK